MKEKKPEEPMDATMSLPEQRQYVKDHIDKPVELGQTWYLLDYKWYDAWKEYVNYNNSASNSKQGSPGPIDNGELMTETGDLKDNLMEGSQFVVIPEPAWEMFVKCYGVAENQAPLARGVIEAGTFNKIFRVEFYPLELYLSHYKQPTEGKLVPCSAGMTIGTLTKMLREMYKVSDVAEVKLLGSYMSSNYDELLDENETLGAANLQPRQFVVIVEKDGAVWPDPDKYKKASASSHFVPGSSVNKNPPQKNSSSAASTAIFKSPENTKKTYGNSNNGYGSTNYNGAASTSTYNHERYERSSHAGLCGLNNLGNTCFMNSALQCLSNVPKLTEFFTSGRWQKDLNPNNPLGMRGEIAETYAELMKTMWGGKTSSCPPRSFKGAVGQFAPRFSGYQQQDSHELMAFLLDGLHEDLNRIKKKPYVEIKASDGRPDEEVAREAWEDYKKRNDSVIIDLFHGQLKSTLECPQCDKNSVTFDPVCYLSLPIPRNEDKYLTVHYADSISMEKPVKCKVKVPTDGCIEDLCVAVANLFDVSKSDLEVAELHRLRFQRMYQSSYALKNIRDGDKIFVYKVDRSTDKTVVALYFREAEKKYSSNVNALSWPMLMSLPNDATYNELYDIIRERYSRFIDEKEEKIYLLDQHNADKDEKCDKGNEKTLVESVNKQEPMEVTTNDSKSTENDHIVGVHAPSKSITCVSNETSEKEADSEDVVMSDSGDSKVPTKMRTLFHLERVSQYGAKESHGLSRDEPITFRQHIYSYLCVEFDKKLVNTVLNIDNALDVEDHPSLYEAEKVRAGLTLSDCLQRFTCKEQLGKHDTWYCPDCKEHVQASKQFALWKLPQYLVIQLKRYKSSYSSYSYQSRDKVDTPVSYPVEDLDLTQWVQGEQESNCRYNLIAVSNHYGGLGGGHYTAYAKNHNMNKWYYFDDSSVSPASKESAVNKNGYLLMYERQS